MSKEWTAEQQYEAWLGRQDMLREVRNPSSPATTQERMNIARALNIASVLNPQSCGKVPEPLKLNQACAPQQKKPELTSEERSQARKGMLNLVGAKMPDPSRLEALTKAPSVKPVSKIDRFVERLKSISGIFRKGP